MSPSTRIPIWADSLSCWNRSAALINALEGIHPRLRQTPPNSPLSTRVTFRPSWAARMAATYPPGPPPTTNTSTSFAKSPTTILPHLHHQQFWVLQELLQPTQEAGSHITIDQAVINAEGDRQDRPDHNLSIPDHRPFGDGPDPENRHLGIVDDRREELPAERPDIGDGEGAALQLLHIQFAAAGP